MKKKSSFQIVDIADELFAVPVGEDAVTFQGIAALSDAAAFLLKHLDTPKTEAELAALLTEEYDIDPGTAGKDVKRFAAELRGLGILED